jgi:DNA-directed RNA polymerase subunit alpha
MFANSGPGDEDGFDNRPTAILKVPPEHYNVPVERLNLSSRTLNCLKRAGIDKVGEVLDMNRSELLKIRNFGEKSYVELFDRLRDSNLLPPDLDPALGEEEPAGVEE